MEAPLHGLLKRQLKKYFPAAGPPAELSEFISAVNKAYFEFDEDRNMLERSLELSSQELFQSNAGMRAIFQAFPDIFFRIDSQGIILDCQSASKEDTFFSGEQWVDKRIQDVPDLKAAAQFAGAIEETKRSNKIKSFEYELVIAGKTNYYEARFVPLQETQIIVIIRNINAKKELENRLLQSQKMEAMGRLAGGIAHDFNNLLTVINGYAQLHIAHLPKNDPLKADLEEIQSAGVRAASLTGQLLAFSRRQVIQASILNLNALILDLDKMLRRIVGENIEMITLPFPELWKVKADSTLIGQAILNLVVNARDAMPSKGKLIIETKNILLSEEYTKQYPDVAPGDYVMIAISDTGHGMTPEVKAHLFEPFFTTKPKGKGTGLGLATSYGIIQQLKGHIGVYSEVGKGTTFKIYIPRCQEASGAVPSQIVSDRSFGGTETILIVEDEPLVRQLAFRILTQKGYTVFETANGDEAMNFIKPESDKKKIDLLLTDVIMPQIGGKELSEAVKSFYPGIKILFMSGYTDEMITHRGILERGVNFIAKPFLPEILIRKVREVLDS
jgi:signal transduction histidine kinase/CheY-like chemotaxis protein